MRFVMMNPPTTLIVAAVTAIVPSTVLTTLRPAPAATSDPTSEMPEMAFVADMSGVWRSGGNCELTRPGETVVESGVTILGPLDLAATVPFHASQMYGRNLTALVQHLAKDGKLALDPADEIAGPMLVVHGGKVRL